MLGLSYGEILLLIGATAALIGPKDLPVIARTAGRLAGRAVGYVQMARGQFDNVMQQSQAAQVHKELQDAMAQLDAIRYELRSISLINPGPIVRRLTDNAENLTLTNGADVSSKLIGDSPTLKSITSCNTNFTSLHSQALSYEKMAESPLIKSALSDTTRDSKNLNVDGGLLNVLPVSAESAGMLPSKRGEAKGSDLVLEAILEAEVAHKAKTFFAQPQNQIQK